MFLAQVTIETHRQVTNEQLSYRSNNDGLGANFAHSVHLVLPKCREVLSEVLLEFDSVAGFNGRERDMKLHISS